MQDAILEKQALSISQQNMEAYFKTHDIKYIAEDAVFIDLSNGKETRVAKLSDKCYIIFTMLLLMQKPILEIKLLPKTKLW
jgi:hypothetical protein